LSYKKILIYNSGGGLGDSIQLFSFILTLKNFFKEGEIYYLSSHDNHYIGKLKNYNVSVKNLDLNLKYFGFRWWHIFKVKNQFSKLNLEKFDLIIDLQSKLRNTLILKRLPTKKFYSSTFKFLFCSNKADYIYKNNIAEMTLLNLEKFLGTKIKRMDYKLDNLNKIYVDEAKRLLPDDNYIGFSLTQGNKYRKKSWPLDNFVSLANKVISMKKKPVFFVEKSNKEIVNKIKTEVKESLFPEHDSNLAGPALVTALASRLEKAISIDNGVMHMMSLSSVPMIVLFGPTNSKKFAPKQENLKILDSKEIYGVKDVSKIKIEDVLKIL